MFVKTTHSVRHTVLHSASCTERTHVMYDHSAAPVLAIKSVLLWAHWPRDLGVLGMGCANAAHMPALAIINNDSQQCIVMSL